MLLKVLVQLAAVNFCLAVTTISQDHKFAAAPLLEIFLNNTNKLRNTLDHGCWCNSFDIGSKQPSGGTGPVDKLDSICRQWILARSCNDHFFGGVCNTYQDRLELENPTYLIGDDLDTEDCSLNDPNDPDYGGCLKKTCEIDIEYVRLIKDKIDRGNFDFKNTTNTAICKREQGSNTPNESRRICDPATNTISAQDTSKLRSISIVNDQSQVGTSCEYNKTFIATSNKIVVQNGCSATFQLDDVPDDVFEITCQSFNYEYRVCPHPHQPVQFDNLWLHQTLSWWKRCVRIGRDVRETDEISRVEKIFGSGVYGMCPCKQAVFVSNGCRGIFRYTLQRQITCSAGPGEVKVCEIGKYIPDTDLDVSKVLEPYHIEPESSGWGDYDGEDFENGIADDPVVDGDVVNVDNQ